MMIQLLFLCLTIPLVTACLLMLLRGSLSSSQSRWIALCGSIITLLVALQLLSQYPAAVDALPADQVVQADAPVQPKFQFHYHWLTLSSNIAGRTDPLQLNFSLGLDGISCLLIGLTAILTFSSVLISWEAIQDRSAEFYIALMILEAGLIGVFCAFDLILFYAFFEFTLIPLFFLIAIWGGTQKRYAAVKFFLYTLAGSFITLLGVISLVVYAASRGLSNPTSIPALANWLQLHPMEPGWQVALFLAISAGFLVKVPVFPFHTWLPLAHVEAPTAGSILLAGVLLKLGIYGLLRLCVPMFPAACLSVGVPILSILSVIGIIYGSLCSLSQRDLKKLVAYSSVAHLGFCTLGLFALNPEGVTGSVLQMVNHGLSTGALFLLVGLIYERYHTRDLDEFSGLAARIPLIACSFVFISMASIGLPGLNGFVGEVLCLSGMYKQHLVYAFLGATGIVLGAWYLLSAVQSMFFAQLQEPHQSGEPVRDMNVREMCALLPLAIACLWIGVQPQSLVELVQADVEAVTAVYSPESKTTSEVAMSPVPESTTHLSQAGLTMVSQRSWSRDNGN